MNISRTIFFLVLSLAVLISVYVFLWFDIQNSNALNIDYFLALENTSAQEEFLLAASKNNSFSDLQEFVKEAYPKSHPEKHALGHVLGEIAFAQHGYEGFGYCDNILSFGCYHGLGLEAIKLEGEVEGISQKLWQGCSKTAKNPDVCLHGLGHVIMIANRYDLLSALEECDSMFPNSNRSFWCHDGVVMEGALGFMPGNQNLNSNEWEDPYWPCNTLPSKYEAVCVRNYVEPVKNNFSFTDREMSEHCLSFTAHKTKSECFDMLGSLYARDFYGQNEMIAQKCEMAGDYFAQCIFGAVNNFSINNSFEYAYDLCERLEGEYSTNCNSSIKSFQL